MGGERPSVGITREKGDMSREGEKGGRGKKETREGRRGEVVEDGGMGRW